MTTNNEAIQIIETLIKHGQGKLCSRYILGLERARDSIIRGSPVKALQEQKEWLSSIEDAKKNRNKK